MVKNSPELTIFGPYYLKIGGASWALPLELTEGFALRPYHGGSERSNDPS